MGTPFFLERLGLDTSADERDVRRAYARELKKIDQELDATGFQRLRECYEQAQAWLRCPEEYDDSDKAAEQALARLFVPLRDDTREKLEVRESSSIAPIPAPVLYDDEPQMSDAQLVVAEFLPRFYATAQSSSKPTLESVREGIKRCLADPRMVSLDASDEFEHIIGHVLAQGWKPGHETLFVAALLEFDWEQDIRRLQRLGHAGNFLSNAIAERQHFFQQEYYSREAQRKLIEMLRLPMRPSDADLVKYALLVEGLMQRYPHVLVIIAGSERAEQWLKYSAEVPEALRRKIIPLTMQKPPEFRRSGRGSYWWVGIAIYGAFQIFRMLSSH